MSGHLRACADIWGNCIGAILVEDRPMLTAVNPRTWIKSRDYLELKFRTSFRSFARQRADLSAVLTGAGKELERTVLFYAQWLARHERTHIKQIERIVGAIR